MLQLRDLPTPEILDKFAQRYPQADTSAVSTFLYLLRVATDLSTSLDECLSRHGLLQGRWWVLILLMREDNRISTPSILSDKVGVARATMTGLLDGLERDGLVARIFDKEDRRRVSIQLTEAGQAKLDQVMPDYYTRLSVCMAKVDAASRTQLTDILQAVHAGMDAFIRP